MTRRSSAPAGVAASRRACGLPLRAYLVALVLGGALPLLAFSLLQSFDAARQHREAIEESLLGRTRALALAVDHELHASLAALSALAASNDLDRGDLGDFYDEARRVTERFPWHIVWLSDVDGRPVADPGAATVALPAIGAADYFRRVVQTREAAFSDLVVDASPVDCYVAIATPVLRGGALKGVLVAAFKPEALSQLLETQRDATQVSVASIVDRRYAIVGRTGDAARWMGHRATPEYIEALRGRAEGFTRTVTVEGDHVYTAFRALPAQGWTLGTAAPTPALERPLREAIRRWTMLGGGLLLLAVSAAMLVGRRIASPIAALASAAHDIVNGREGIRLPRPGVREVAALSGALIEASDAARQRDALAAELKLAFDNLQEGVVTSTPDGRFLYWNPAALAMHGFRDAGEVRSRLDDMHRVFAIETLDGAAVPHECWPLARILRGETLCAEELRVRRLDTGRESIFSYSGGVALGPDGRARLALVSVSDIGERKRAELALRRSEEHFRLLVEQSVDGIFVTDGEGRYIDVNSAGCAMLGYARDELLGRSIADVVAPEETARIGPEVARLSGGHTVRSEWQFRRKDGSLFVGEVLARKLPDGRLQAFLRDVTERRQAETALRERRAQLQQLQDLQTASLTAAAIAHELGQPLSAIASYNEAALQMLRAGDPKPQRLAHAVQASAEQAQRAGRVVRELLEFLHARDSGVESVDLNAAVLRALVVTQAEGLPPLRVVLDLDEALEPVRANALQIEKVLVNLLVNAGEAMRAAPAGASASASAAHDGKATVTIRTRRVGGEAHLLLSDAGPGLPPADAARIFEPFYTTKRRGIGMGLAISRALIEASGGRLWYEPGSGPGATFRFSLPLEAATHDGGEAA